MTYANAHNLYMQLLSYDDYETLSPLNSHATDDTRDQNKNLQF